MIENVISQDQKAYVTGIKLTAVEKVVLEKGDWRRGWGQVLGVNHNVEAILT